MCLVLHLLYTIGGQKGSKKMNRFSFFVTKNDTFRPEFIGQISYSLSERVIAPLKSKHPIRVISEDSKPMHPEKRPGFPGRPDCRKRGVIPSQRARWRGNPPVFLNLFNQKSTFFSYLGDCHTSDLGHWFAMTVFLTRSAPGFPRAPCCSMKFRITSSASGGTAPYTVPRGHSS